MKASKNSATRTGSKIVLDLSHGPDNPRNSEGSFVTLKDGTIQFLYTHYYGKSWLDEATARISMRFSKDGGATWSDRDKVIVKNEGGCNVMSVSLLRLKDGRIALWYLRKNSVDDCHPFMRISSDECKTWSEPTPCIPAPGYFVVNNDRVIQLETGRLVIPAAYHRNRIATQHGQQNHSGLDGRAIAMFFISDDVGKTWRESKDWWALPVRTGSGLQEPGAVELEGGRIYTYCRTDVGCQYEMISEDGGETMTPPVPSPFKSPCAPLCIKRIPSTGDLLAIWNDHSGKLLAPPKHGSKAAGTSWGRTPLVSAISKDEGRTWTHHKLLETDPKRGFCYCAIHFAGEAALLAYCCGGGSKSVTLQDLCIRRVTLEWLYC